MKRQTLLLHGFGQNGQSFYERLGSVRRLSKQEYSSPDGPFLVKVVENKYIINSDPEVQVASQLDNLPENSFAYYLWEQDIQFKSGRKFFCMDQAVDKIISQIEDDRFNNIIAFSQGATALLVALKYVKIKAKICLVSPWWYERDYQPTSIQIIEQVSQDDITNDVTVIYGTTDNSIPLQSFHNLKQQFSFFSYIEHEGGHFVPGNKLFKEFWKQWLNE